MAECGQASLKNCSSIFRLMKTWNIYWLIQPLSALTLAVQERKKTRQSVFRQKSRRIFNQDSSGNWCPWQCHSLYFNCRTTRATSPKPKLWLKTCLPIMCLPIKVMIQTHLFWNYRQAARKQWFHHELTAKCSEKLTSIYTGNDTWLNAASANSNTRRASVFTLW